MNEFKDSRYIESNKQTNGKMGMCFQGFIDCLFVCLFLQKSSKKKLLFLLESIEIIEVHM